MEKLAKKLTGLMLILMMAMPLLPSTVFAEQADLDRVVEHSKDPQVIAAMKELKAAFPNVRTENGLTSVADWKPQVLSYYENEFTNEYKTKNNGKVPDVKSYFSLLDDDSIALQYYYIKTNSNPLGSKHKLDKADDKSTYSQLHAKYHPVFRAFLEKHGLYDIFLVDPVTGDVVYTVFKELDYTTSLNDGPNAKNGLGEAFQNVLKSKDPNGYQTAADPYFVSYDVFARFVSVPIFENGELIGVLIHQIPVDY